METYCIVDGRVSQGTNTQAIDKNILVKFSLIPYFSMLNLHQRHWSIIL